MTNSKNKWQVGYQKKKKLKKKTFIISLKFVLCFFAVLYKICNIIIKDTIV